MKDINDAQTIDWVDSVEVLDVLNDEIPTASRETKLAANRAIDRTINSLLIAPTVNPAWREVITKLVEQTINDIENQQEQ
jgi:hypothetical protein